MDAYKVRSVKQLIECRLQKNRLKYLFFWGHIPKSRDIIDASCLSQWYGMPFYIDGIRYPTAEHFMMAEKAKLFGDQETRGKILSAQLPGAAKKLGRTVRDFNGATWEKRRFEIVVTGNFAKFGSNAEAKDFLMKTGNKVLVEASPRDRIWGIGLSQHHEHIEVPEKWRGLNLLGFALMEVRARLFPNR